MFECLEEFIQSFVWIHGFIEQSHELAADDGTGCVILRTGKGLLVADTETDHAWVAEVHAVDMVEVSELGITEVALGTRDAGGANHIDEAIGMLVDEVDALLTCFRCNEHDDPYIILVCHGFYLFQIVFEGEVGDDDSIHIGLVAVFEELFIAHVEDGIQVTHKDEWHIHPSRSCFLHLGKNLSQCHSIA